MRLNVLAGLMVGGAFVLCGCLGLGSKPVAPRPKIIGFPRGNTSDGTKREPRLVGRVAMVNPEGRFVLVACGPWSAPDEGTALKCLRNGVESGIITVTAERRGSHVTADITTGQPAQGDQAFQ